jgi:hypothetical protein
LQLNSADIIAVKGATLYGVADTGITLTTEGEITLHGARSAAICSASAQISAGASGAEICANSTNIISDVTISEGSTAHTLGSETLGTSSGSGRLTVAGAITGGKYLLVNESITCASSVVAQSVMAKSVDPEIGVFKLRTSPKKQAVKSVSAKYNKRKVDKAAQKLALEVMAEYTLKYLRNALYTVTKVASAVVKPMFSRSSGQGRSVITPTTVENDNGTVYIYPGEEFWTGSGMVELTPREVENLQIEQEVKEFGAQTLFLHSQED